MDSGFGGDWGRLAVAERNGEDLERDPQALVTDSTLRQAESVDTIFPRSGC
jgi:hypothetical protein